jgi:protein tyrosine phosphatase (PTP) superfamily phosphohydrolase (DUF442 family)
VRNYAPNGQSNWQPADNSVRLVPPQEPPAAPPAPPVGVRENPGADKNPADKGTPTPPLPVGIAQFALAKEQVASGLKPELEGLDWLRDQGYKSVLYVRKPGEDDAANRRVAEMRGLKYQSLEVSPLTLAKATVDAFNRIVDEPANRPLFVYDQDGTLAGGLWYLHFRTALKLDDVEARARAARLGLRSRTEGEAQTKWWGALEKFLSEQQ